jgi:hypothetical protein
MFCEKVNRITYLNEFFVAINASEFEREFRDMENVMGLQKKMEIHVSRFQ